MDISVEKPIKDCSIQSDTVLATTKKNNLTLGVAEKESEHVHAIHQKLEHVLAVQRQLLEKIAVSERNAIEAKQGVAARDDQIKELRASYRQIAERLRRQVEKHVQYLIRLRFQILDFQGAQAAHLQSHGHMKGTIIRTLRGGRAAGQVDAMEHPQQWDDDVRPMRSKSQCSSTSATFKESLAEVMRVHADQEL